MSVVFPSRPFLEWNVRRRVRAVPNVAILEDHDVAGLTVTPDRGRVTGVRVVNRGSGGETLSADVVVDAIACARRPFWRSSATAVHRRTS
jgi:hypothetical protein